MTTTVASSVLRAEFVVSGVPEVSAIKEVNDGTPGRNEQHGGDEYKLYDFHRGSLMS
jgi:hypothetical protein